MKTSCAIVSACAVALAVPAVAAPTYTDYVQDGLVALYDAEFNATNAQGVAIHDATATTWVNLKPGAGDLVLPDGKTTINAKAIVLNKATATATGCAAAYLTTPVTIETCCKSLTTSLASGNERLYFQLFNRAAIGTDRRGGQQICVYTPKSSALTGLNYRWYVSSTFAAYATVQRSYSLVAPTTGSGSVYAAGLDAGAETVSSWSPSGTKSPDGSVKIGHADLEMSFGCIRIYNRELSETERQHNNAVDAIRFCGADPATAVMPYAITYDADGNIVNPYSPEGTVSVEPGNQGKGLVNAGGSATLDNTARPAVLANAVKYKLFDAAKNTSTTFLGGWWDFSSGAFLPSDLSGRTVTLDGGAVVTNVGAVTLAGATGMNNKLSIKGSSAMDAANVTLGAKDGEQHNDCEITDGSSLKVSGNLKMSAFPKQIGNNGNNRTKNVVTVAGANTSLTVAGGTYLSWINGSDGSYNASTGGNTLYVTNAATADLGDVYLTQGLRFGGDDRVFIEGSRVTTRSLRLADYWSSAGRGYSETRFFVGAGSVVTNTGALYIGTSASNGRNGKDVIELCISNATFHTGSPRPGPTGYWYLLDGPRATLRLSGKDAKFTIGSNISTYFGAHPNNKFIVENGATYTWLTGGFNSTTPTSDDTIIVRSGATLNWPSGFSTVGTAKTSTRNKVIVEGDSRMNVTGNGTIFGTDCALIVSNSECRVGNWFSVGTDDRDSRALFAIGGTHPVFANGWNFVVVSNSCLRIDLPETGYDAGYATTAKPVIDCAISSGEMAFAVDKTSRIELTGAAALQRYADQTRLRAEYVLIRANHIKLTDAQIEAARASLPTDMTLFKRYYSGKDELVLKVRPTRRGFCVILR